MDTKKNYKEVRYELKWGRVCITPCFVKYCPDGDREMVGSARCRACNRHIDIDTDKQIVKCSTLKVSSSSKRNVKDGINRPRRVMCVTTGKVYYSVNQASKDYDLASSTIAKAIEEKRLVKKQWEFRYVE